MAKQHKIKRYHKKEAATYKARPHPLFILLLIVVAGGLVFVGMSIYDPVAEFLMNLGRESEQTSELSSEPSSEPEIPEESVPEPEPLNLMPDMVRAMELPLETARDSSALTAWLDALPDNINTAMVRIKGADGMLMYSSRNMNSAAWDGIASSTINLELLASRLNERGITLAVWMSAFQDPVAARGDREGSAILHKAGMLWLDNAADMGGKPWLNPYSERARDYLVSLVDEVAGMGAGLVILDDVRFPDDPTAAADFSDNGGLDKRAILSRFMEEADSAAGAHGSKVIPYFLRHQGGDAASALAESAVRYGGYPADLTQGDILIWLDSPAALGDITDTLRNRLVCVLEGEALSENLLKELEDMGVRQFIRLA